MVEPRAYTNEEVRDAFLNHIRGLVEYWAALPDVDKATNTSLTIKDRLDGVAFSILNIFDGTTGLPAFDITVSPHPDDKQYHIDNGENWYEPGTCINHVMLHEMWYKYSSKD